MAIKSANVTARVQPEIKQQAEAILATGVCADRHLVSADHNDWRCSVFAVNAPDPYTRQHDRGTVQRNDGKRISAGKKRSGNTGR